MSERLCLVEDDPTISLFVAEKLRESGFGVSVFETAEAVPPEPFDLYILDWMLPGALSGLQLCEHIRKSSPLVPVLMLSALSEPSHRVEGLRSGADDYLSKPFEMEELLLRVNGMLRRRSWYRSLPTEGAIYVWADCAVDFQKMEGRRGNRTYSLTQKECMLLKLLIENEGEAVSRDTVLERVWGYHVYPSTRTVDNFIMRLRKYFEREPGNPQHLLSVRGLGYRFIK
jgi:two-component system, OmpR family, alkaline phosphatase synthesis response regulator PhoP